MKVQAYVIKGSYSEYSDRSYWTVAVHLDQDNAEQHLVRLNAALKVWESIDRDEREAMCGGMPYGSYPSELDTVRGFIEALDSQRYWMETVPLLVDVPETPLTLQVPGKAVEE